MKDTVLCGNVTPFKGNGRRLGYPTANIQVDTGLEDGIYFGYGNLVDFTDRPALIFVGTPTTMGDHERRVEVHFLDIPDRDYYGEKLLVKPKYYHRPNKTFDTVDDLLQVMKDDELVARHWFQQNRLAKAGDLSDT